MINIDNNGFTSIKDRNNSININNNHFKVVLEGRVCYYKVHFGTLYFSEDRETWKHMIGDTDEFEEALKKMINEFQ